MPDDPFDFMEDEPSKESGEKSAEDLAENDIRYLKSAYSRLFGTGEAMDGDVELVFNDLATFCHVFDSTFSSNARVHARLEGRREVFMRIIDFMNLDYTELLKVYMRSFLERRG